MRGNKFWMNGKERVCRMCGEGVETMEHVRQQCVGLKEEERTEKELLNERGQIGTNEVGE
jgi:hypothetical protein